MQKKADYKNINLQSVISRRSNQIMTLHPVKKEWRIVIVILGLAKAIIMLISAFAGYSFFNHYIIKMLDGKDFFGISAILLGNIAAITLLILIEVGTAYSLEKMFKFFYRKRLITASAILGGVLILYTFSFITSTNGLALSQEQRADGSNEILISADKQKAALIANYDLTIVDYNTQIKQISSNPQGWSEGKRSYLTKKQLKNIASINAKKENKKQLHESNLQKIIAQSDEYLNKNKIVKTETAKDFYMIMTIIMLMQLFVTGVLMFFYYLIRNQESKDSIVEEDLKEIADTVSEHAETVVMNSMINTSNRIAHAVAANMEQHEYIDYVPATTAKNTPNKTSQPDEKTNPIVTGFGKPKSSQKQPAKNAKHPSRLDGSEVLATDKNLNFLAKHKLILAAIIQLKPQPKDTISNDEIKHIKQLASTAKFIGRSTIQNVFSAMQAVTQDEIKNLLK